MRRRPERVLWTAAISGSLVAHAALGAALAFAPSSLDREPVQTEIRFHDAALSLPDAFEAQPLSATPATPGEAVPAASAPSLEAPPADAPDAVAPAADTAAVVPETVEGEAIAALPDDAATDAPTPIAPTGTADAVENITQPLDVETEDAAAPVNEASRPAAEATVSDDAPAAVDAPAPAAPAEREERIASAVEAESVAPVSMIGRAAPSVPARSDVAATGVQREAAARPAAPGSSAQAVAPQGDASLAASSSARPAPAPRAPAPQRPLADATTGVADRAPAAASPAIVAPVAPAPAPQLPSSPVASVMPVSPSVPDVVAAVGPREPVPVLEPRETPAEAYEKVLGAIAAESGGRCFMAFASAGEEEIDVAGFAADADRVDALGRRIEEATNMPVDLRGHAVSMPQCAALSFARGLGAYPQMPLSVELEASAIASGGELVGRVRNITRRWFYLLVVDDSGRVQEIAGDRQSEAGPGAVEFRVPVTALDEPVDTVQLLLAISSDEILQMVWLREGDPADAYFDDLRAEILKAGAGIDFGVAPFVLR